MTTMTRWDPFQDLRSAQDEMAQMSPMLAQALGLHAQQASGRAATTAWAPALDISERKDAYLVTVELPGVKLDDLQITLEDGLLTIQGITDRDFPLVMGILTFEVVLVMLGNILSDFFVALTDPRVRLPPGDRPREPDLIRTSTACDPTQVAA